MTSNLGSDLIQEATAKKESLETIQSQLWDRLKNQFRPEFLNRLDSIIVFEPLTQDQLANIFDLQLSKIQARLARQGYKLEITQEAKDYLIAQGYDSAFGARPLKRLLETKLVDELAFYIIDGTFKSGNTIKVDLNKDKLTFTHNSSK